MHNITLRGGGGGCYTIYAFHELLYCHFRNVRFATGKTGNYVISVSKILRIAIKLTRKKAMEYIREKVK